MMRIVLSCCVGFLGLICQAQVQVDKPLQLTGAGSDARVTGIQESSLSTDAASVEAVQRNGMNYAPAGGSANAITVTLSPAITAYSPGQIISFRAANANTGAVTVSVNGILPAVAIKKSVSLDLQAGDILAGQMVSIIYDGTYFQMITPPGQPGASPPACPAGYVATGSFCAEVNERAAATHRNANYTCFANNGRLCSLYEWYYLCDNSGAFGMTNMTNNKEWTTHLDYTPDGCTSQQTTQTWYSATLNYRCCADKN